MTIVDVLAVIVALGGLVAAFIARKIWLMVEGELAASWRWLLPSVPVYAVSYTVLIMHNFMRKFGAVDPVLNINFEVNILEKRSMFSMQVWEPIILVLRNVQVLVEMLFLVLVIVGLARQYRLFQKLAEKQG
ncbi:MAG: hypothetical protein A2074_07310 [Candidatus Aquicultor primus]|jgi:hypothetical protein|uniref:Uncharacterized protein n=1 Tax=Candidatus Aquicultor primus TaxID=1797195 RepID=A0A1F2UUR2_9ACTN|nr:MAG: hypothetical protein A2074_07310 [Candidatus Aquicultor primus]